MPSKQVLIQDRELLYQGPCGVTPEALSNGHFNPQGEDGRGGPQLALVRTSGPFGLPVSWQPRPLVN